jgi:hypothetical protein
MKMMFLALSLIGLVGCNKIEKVTTERLCKDTLIYAMNIHLCHDTIIVRGN